MFPAEPAPACVWKALLAALEVFLAVALVRPVLAARPFRGFLAFLGCFGAVDLILTGCFVPAPVCSRNGIARHHPLTTPHHPPPCLPCPLSYFVLLLTLLTQCGNPTAAIAATAGELGR